MEREECNNSVDGYCDFGHATVGHKTATISHSDAGPYAANYKSIDSRIISNTVKT